VDDVFFHHAGKTATKSLLSRYTGALQLMQDRRFGGGENLNSFVS
jgi:hypothetical protein